MGHILDVVPNHMGIARSANPWWMDVLENGPSSRYARFFDIEWQPIKDELADKVLLPILGDHYGAVLEEQELAARVSRRRVRRAVRRRLAAARAGHVSAHSRTRRRPAWHRQRATDLDATSCGASSPPPSNLPPRAASDANAIVDPLAREGDRQAASRRARRSERSAVLATSLDGRWRPSTAPGDSRDRSIGWMRCSASSRTGCPHWRVASEEINYRRFFDVNQLAACGVEDPVVFDEVHKFVLELLARGAADRAADRSRRRPVRARRLPAAAAGAGGRSAARLPTSGRASTWSSKRSSGRTNSFQPTGPCTGPPATNSPASSTTCSWTAGTSARSTTSTSGSCATACAAVVRRSRLPEPSKQVVHATMSGDINSLGHQLNRLLGAEPALPRLHPVQPDRRPQGTDRLLPGLPHLHHRPRPVPARTIAATSARAVRCAKRRIAALVVAWSSTSSSASCSSRRWPAARKSATSAQRFIGKFQQITSPVAAKGIEDTAFYVYNRLVSLNEVGGDPTRFGARPDRRARLDVRTAAAVARGAVDHVDARHQARRGRARAIERPLGNARGDGKRAVTRWRALNRRFKARRRRRRRARRERRVSALPDARRRLAVRPRTARPRFAERAQELHGQGAARGQGAHQLDHVPTTIRGGRARSSSTSILDRRPPVPAGVPAVPGPRRRARRSTTASPSC